MPSVPQPPTSTARNVHPPDPNQDVGLTAQTTPKSVDYQPTPAITHTASHIHTHVLPRRFLGPIPENVVHSDRVEAQGRLFREMRRTALRKMHVIDGEGYRRGGRDGALGTERRGGGHGAGVRKVVRRIKVIRRGKHGEDVEEEVEIEPEEGSEDDQGQEVGKGLAGRRRRKQKRKGVWIGESFDIGREFVIPTRASTQVSEPEWIAEHDVEETEPTQPQDEAGYSIPTRPPVTARSTQDTFVTARTEFTQNTSASTSTLHLPSQTNDNATPRAGSDGSSVSLIPPTNIRNSQSSSLQPLLGHGLGSTDDITEDPRDVTDKKEQMSPKSQRDKSANRLIKLKSAIRKPSSSSVVPASIASAQVHPHDRPNGSIARSRGKSKSVQFPVDPVQYIENDGNGQDGAGKVTSSGDDTPADPEQVLSREGSEAAGTSAGAVDRALEEEDEDIDELIKPGDVVMRGEYICLLEGQRADECDR